MLGTEEIQGGKQNYAEIVMRNMDGFHLPVLWWPVGAGESSLYMQDNNCMAHFFFEVLAN